jgi:hypothetical protein
MASPSALLAQADRRQLHHWPWAEGSKSSKFYLYYILNQEPTRFEIHHQIFGGEEY